MGFLKSAYNAKFLLEKESLFCFQEKKPYSYNELLRWTQNVEIGISFCLLNLHLPTKSKVNFSVKKKYYYEMFIWKKCQFKFVYSNFAWSCFFFLPFWISEFANDKKMQIKVSFNAQDKLNVDLTSIVSYSQLSTFTTTTMRKKKEEIKTNIVLKKNFIYLNSFRWNTINTQCLARRWKIYSQFQFCSNLNKKKRFKVNELRADSIIILIFFSSEIIISSSHEELKSLQNYELQF